MIQWTILNSEKIHRVGYNKKKENLYIDFKGSETDMVFLKVPDSVYDIFIEVKSPDNYYAHCVDGYFEVKQLSSK